MSETMLTKDGLVVRRGSEVSRDRLIPKSQPPATSSNALDSKSPRELVNWTELPSVLGQGVNDCEGREQFEKCRITCGHHSRALDSPCDGLPVLLVKQ